MDIFKLGDKILALLEAVFGFWNNQISLVFAMLGQSPVSFKGGGPWAVIEGIEPVFVAVGSSLVVLFFVIGFCSESIDVKDEMRFESIFRMLIRLGLAEWFVANNVTIMKAFFTCKLWDAGEKGLTLSAFEWEKDRKTLIYGQVDYMYGEALYKPEMKEGNPIRLYSLDEITEIFCKLGLRICNSFADFSGKPSSDNDIQLMVYSIRE
ncbi:class I SAM-dependent methyltransferase [Dorea formicigenerans]|uniref:class I SAM-dependent methyltransferase n=1 Tax=Dorea formicigenerans TaxID=39486 RepID=UPI003A8B7709